MDGESNHLWDPPPLISNLSRSINPNSSSSSSSLGLHKSSESDFLRSVQDAFKRHRSSGMMPTNNFLPRRCLPPQKETSQNSGPCSGLTEETKRTVNEAHEDASLTLPSISGTITDVYDKYSPYEEQENQPAPLKGVELNGLSYGQLNHAPISEGLKKVQFSSANSATSQGMDWEVVNQLESSSALINEPKHQNLVNVDPKGGLRVEQGNASLEVRMSSLQNQIHHLRNFLHNNASNPATQSSVAGSSCVTTTSVHATSAPMLNSTTHSACPHQDSLILGSLADANPNPSNVVQNGVRLSCLSLPDNGAIVDKGSSGEHPVRSTTRPIPSEVKDIQQRNLAMQSQVSNNPSLCYDQSKKEKGQGSDGEVHKAIPPHCPPSKNPSYDTKLEPSKSEKQDKAPARKKGYDPDLFFKVNGKLYQRLGKIGSGGSSEVHKVISSDCNIYALKKIKLKGRDYATAYGFCQEILYLKKLKGKNNIIQLIDYEVTDKALLHEVMNDSFSNKDNKVKDDGYIYMVLEYGEIDLAHMLAQKWKEIEGSNSSIDENWLRFYWQQMLQAVNKIHEERIVHSDLKPANFLLVRGSLKLIDFGIAKAIMSDTTNIQRDAQVGTLSYMSPEAFLCNESDANGNVIKCGRPSDIWSLGCILYQMVYGRTPFSEYKTFWAKFKVITNPNHEITYGRIPNPWLLDLMKKCLAWDRNLRWRIPELLEHPFLVPPVLGQLSPPLKQNCKAVELISESCADDLRATMLCCELQQLLGDPTQITRDQQSRLLLRISNICLQVKEHMIQTAR